MYQPTALIKNYPLVLTDLFDESLSGLSKTLIIEHCNNIYSKIKVTSEQAINCVLDTKDQYLSKLWFRLRCGRITASKMKSVCKTKVDSPSKSVINDICYLNKFSSQATKWGCDHEKEAKQTYLKLLISKGHEDVVIKDVGFVIDPKFPYMGASPDGIASCKCCGDVLVEVKCPFCRKDFDIDEKVNCLVKNENLELDKKHSYYYQVQTQLLVSGKEYCDFIVWTKKDLFVQRIGIDENIIKEIVAKSELFFKNVILPEINCKFFSRAFKNSSC